MKNKVVYAWLNAGIPFYIGIGSLKRSQSRHKRNSYCSNKRAKAERENCFEIRILQDNLTWKEACELEQSYISSYGRIDNGTGILTNMTDGGDGAYGCIPSTETRKKMSKSRLGYKPSKEAREKMSEAKQGTTRQPHTKETKEKIGNSNRKPTGLTGKLSPCSTPVSCEGKKYDSLGCAAKDIGCSRQTIIDRIRSKNFSSYGYLNRE